MDLTCTLDKLRTTTSFGEDHHNPQLRKIHDNLLAGLHIRELSDKRDRLSALSTVLVWSGLDSEDVCCGLLWRCLHQLSQGRPFQTESKPQVSRFLALFSSDPDQSLDSAFTGRHLATVRLRQSLLESSVSFETLTSHCFISQASVYLQAQTLVRCFFTATSTPSLHHHTNQPQLPIPHINLRI